MTQKGPESIDDGQNQETGAAPRTAVRNLAGCFAVGVLILLVLVACGLIVFAPRGGSDATVAEETRETAETENVALDDNGVETARENETESAAPTPTAMPTAVVASTDGASIEAITAEDDPNYVDPENDPETYVYNVGGQAYAAGYTAVMVTADGVFEVTGTPEEIAAVLAEDDENFTELGPWTRIWRAANLEYTPWTFFFRMSCDAPLDGNAQWHQATELKIIGPEGGINCHAQLRRDLISSAQIDPDPYTVADLKNAGELAWFVDGTGDATCGDATYSLGLSTGQISVVQVPFKYDFNGIIDLYFSAEEGETLFFRQGEVISTEATCVLP